MHLLIPAGRGRAGEGRGRGRGRGGEGRGGEVAHEEEGGWALE